jgi:hypothetical protein
LYHLKFLIGLKLGQVLVNGFSGVPGYPLEAHGLSAGFTDGLSACSYCNRSFGFRLQKQRTGYYSGQFYARKYFFCSEFVNVGLQPRFVFQLAGDNANLLCHLHRLLPLLARAAAFDGTRTSPASGPQIPGVRQPMP